MTTLDEVFNKVNLGKQFIQLFDPGNGFKAEFEFLCRGVGNGICADLGKRKNEVSADILNDPNTVLGNVGQKAFDELCAWLNKPYNP